jgi:hypothetical protein
MTNTSRQSEIENIITSIKNLQKLVKMTKIQENMLKSFLHRAELEIRILRKEANLYNHRIDQKNYFNSLADMICNAPIWA